MFINIHTSLFFSIKLYLGASSCPISLRFSFSFNQGNKLKKHKTSDKSELEKKLRARNKEESPWQKMTWVLE